MYFEIEVKDYGHREENRGSGGDYDYDWSEYHDYHYRGIRATENSYDVGLFPGENGPRRGDDVFVVYVEYDSGDSFGNERGVRTHLWAFTNKDRARKLCAMILRDADERPKYDFDDGKITFEGVSINANEWKGYFERFCNCDIETLVLK